MMNDSVREELETKIGKPPSTSPEPRIEEEIFAAELTIPEPVTTFKTPAPVVSEPPPIAPRPKAITAELNKRQTSPTLVDFQHKNPTLPDWRLQLQNSIRKRASNGASETGASATAAVIQPTSTPTAAVVPTQKAAEPVPVPRNEKVANALKRIEESRRTFSAHGVAVAAARKTSTKPAVESRAFPFDVVERAPTVPKREVPKPQTVETPKPKLVSPLRIEKKKFDTNKLPPIPEPEAPLPVALPLEPPSIVTNPKLDLKFDRLEIRNETARVEITQPEGAYDEIDDLAPLSMRFGAAVFDLIIGGFAAAIILSPFLVSNASLASLSGFLAIGGAILVVMFIYQTATMAFIGRTFGMKLFSLEIIDAEMNELPTLHQSAVNSAVYLLSLLLLGIGFLPALFNEERRTLHDMLSGTLLIREY